MTVLEELNLSEINQKLDRLLSSVEVITSTSNASTATLSGGGTFTGTAEQNDAPDVMCSCYSDADGTLYFDFSINGSDWRTFPTNGFEVKAGIHEFHTAVKGARYFRVRFINGSGAQSVFQLQCYFGSFRQPNSPLNQNLSADSDAIVVRPYDVNIDKILGRFAGVQEGSKFGSCFAMDSADTDFEIWVAASDTESNYLKQKTFLTAATDLYVASSDNADNGDIKIIYLDSNGAKQEADVTLTGNTAINFATGLDCNRIVHIDGAVNGTVIVAATSSWTSGAPSTASTTLAYMAAGDGQTQQSHDTVPAGFKRRIKFVACIVARSSGAAGSCVLKMQIRENGTTAWATKRIFPVTTSGIIAKPVAGVLLNPLTNIRVLCTDVSDLDSNITVDYHYDDIPV